MELRDIHKWAQQKLSGGAPCYARRPKTNNTHVGPASLAL